MELPTLPVGVDLDDLPAAPLPAAPLPAGGYGWSAAVPEPARSRRGRTGSAAIVLGIMAVVAFLVSLAMISSSDAPGPIPATMLSVLFALWVASAVFWLWMLVDAISNARVMWALAIFFLGVFGALGYALLGKAPRS
ncbi:MAG: hypothetical protein ACRDGK_05060 [Actinomycetota bacterium]